MDERDCDDLAAEPPSPVTTTETDPLAGLEQAIREQWRLGQNIVLCWTPVDDGIQILAAPHYFLSQFSAALSDSTPTDRLAILNGRFIRRLIAGERRMSVSDLSSTARRLGLTPVLLACDVTAGSGDELLAAAEELITRYGINFVESRAVLLFDIVDFSLFTPFEQISQLSSLSYSLNAAYSKLLKKDIAVEFARTTTGDGFYVWNHSVGPRGNMELFQFMLLVIADNAIAQRKAAGRTVPRLRTAFHIGSHFEFFQVDGLNPTLHSYIVGDVTIELARMVEIATPGQIFVGDFTTLAPTSAREEALLIEVDSQHFVQRANKYLQQLRGLELSGERVESLFCQLTGETGASAGQSVRRFRIIDKHGRSRHAYNLRINIRTDGGRIPLILGIQEYYLPRPERPRGRIRWSSEFDSGGVGGSRQRPRLLSDK
ncbi:MAG: hypothetical protein RBS88_02390 [Spongiibacteraceae bacterium]|jgi:hypothetical protein|nr:hypothetical protein [Spongiibacteraceae bacterium]